MPNCAPIFGRPIERPHRWLSPLSPNPAIAVAANVAPSDTSGIVRDTASRASGRFIARIRGIFIYAARPSWTRLAEIAAHARLSKRSASARPLNVAPTSGSSRIRAGRARSTQICSGRTTRALWSPRPSVSAFCRSLMVRFVARIAPRRPLNTTIAITAALSTSSLSVAPATSSAVPPSGRAHPSSTSRA